MPISPSLGAKKIASYNKQELIFSSPLEPSLLFRTPQVQLPQHLSHSPQRLIGRKHNIQKTPEICIVVTETDVRGHPLDVEYGDKDKVKGRGRQVSGMRDAVVITQTQFHGQGA